MATESEINDVFSYHAPTEEQLKTYNELRAHFKMTAHLINNLIPESPYRTVVFRKLHEANMIANAAVALDGRSLR